MTLPINYLTILCAAFPVFILLLLIIFRWGVPEAAPIAAFVTIFTSFSVFRTPAIMISVESSKGIWNALILVFLFWTAALLYRILKQASFKPAPADPKKDTYHKDDVYKELKAEYAEDLKGITMREAIPAFAALIAVSFIMMVFVRPDGPVSFGFNYPESSTGYGYVNAAVSKYCPLISFVYAGVILLAADIIGFVVLGVRGQLKNGGFSRALKKSCEMAMPAGIAVCALYMTLLLMQNTGQIYALTAGTVKEIPLVPAAFITVIAAPAVHYFADKKRVKLEAEEAELVEKAKKAGKIRRIHRPKFYETRTGGLTIAFLAILAAYALMSAGIWGSDETLTIDGFGVVITALLYCPMRTFIFDKAGKLVES